MRIVQNLQVLRRTRQPIVLAAGFFDGLHVGHQQVIRAAQARAAELHGQAWVLTFDRHPLRLLHPDSAPPLLTSHRHKLVLLEQMGLHGCLALPFTRATADLEPTDFIRQLQRGMPRLAEIFVGTNWRFGRGAAGTPKLVSALGRELGFATTVMRPVRRERETVSSTRIRDLIRRGRLEEAQRLLGRPFSVFGTVTHGLALGRTLGFPTANLDYHNEALPPSGVYLAHGALYGSDRRLLRSTRHSRWKHPPVFNGILNLGYRPTLDQPRPQQPVMEVHLLDQQGDYYGQDMEVFFVKRLRAEKCFASLNELQAQLQRDAARARRLLGLPIQDRGMRREGTRGEMQTAREKARRMPFTVGGERTIVPPNKQKKRNKQ